MPDLTGAPTPVPPDSSDPFRDFRPRRGRAVGLTAAVLSVVIFVAVAIALPGSSPTDQILIGLLGVLIAGLLVRYAMIRATPTRDGLVVRNLMTTRRLEWAQVVRVQFGGGAPWVTLDLDDTDQVAVMAIQRADGPRADAEASRLAALVQALGEAR